MDDSDESESDSDDDSDATSDEEEEGGEGSTSRRVRHEVVHVMVDEEGVEMEVSKSLTARQCFPYVMRPANERSSGGWAA